MRSCSVETTGRDDETHTIELDASGLFEAGYQAAQRWALFWWFDPQALLTIKAGNEEWNVRQSSVRAWREALQSNVSSACSKLTP